MDTSIIIVNWNTREMLRNCLVSLGQQVDSNNINVIVVDNNSSDGSREMVSAQFPSVHLIDSGGNIGFGKANNLAKPYVDTQFIVFLNPDTIVPEDSIAKMVNHMESNPDVGALGCKMKYPDGIVQPLGLQWFPSPLTEFLKIVFLSEKMQTKLRRYLPYVDPNENGYVSKLFGACLIVRKSVLDQVGWFDERFFMYCEDVDLCKRIAEAGWKLFYLSDVTIVHVCGGAEEKTSSNFSVLMTCESVSKLIQKCHGNAGTALYRLVIFGGSIFRLFLASILKIFSIFSRIGRGVDYRYVFTKYSAMLKWCLNLQKARVKN